MRLGLPERKERARGLEKLAVATSMVFHQLGPLRATRPGLTASRAPHRDSVVPTPLASWGGGAPGCRATASTGHSRGFVGGSDPRRQKVRGVGRAWEGGGQDLNRDLGPGSAVGWTRALGCFHLPPRDPPSSAPPPWALFALPPSRPAGDRCRGRGLPHRKPAALLALSLWGSSGVGTC